MNIARYLLPLCVAGFLTACGGSDDDVPVAPDASAGANQLITEVASTQGYNALLAAATKAGLATELADPGKDWTVFAPTDAAFNALATTLGFADANAMVTALPATTLESIVRYHLVDESVTSSELLLVSDIEVPTEYRFEGSRARIDIETTGGIRIADAVLNEATVTAADYKARNGVIHEIDRVLVPPGVFNIVQMAQLNSNFSSLVTALQAAGLDTGLAAAGPFTVFAPTNTAFATGPTGLSATDLGTVLGYHVISGQVLASGIPFGSPIATASGQTITITNGSPALITDTSAAAASIIETDIRASNGVIHVIDKVLIPAL